MWFLGMINQMIGFQGTEIYSKKSEYSANYEI